MKRTNDKPIKDVIGHILKYNSWGDKMIEAKIRTIYEQEVPRAIQERTKKLVYFKGTLSIYFTSASLRQEMFYLKDNIQDIVNKSMRDTIVKKIILY